MGLSGWRKDAVTGTPHLDLHYELYTTLIRGIVFVCLGVEAGGHHGVKTGDNAALLSRQQQPSPLAKSAPTSWMQEGTPITALVAVPDPAKSCFLQC